MKIAIFGFGNVGRSLAKLFNNTGYDVMVCTQAGTSLASEYSTASFAEGAAKAELIVLAIPYQAAQEVLAPLTKTLAGKIVVDCTNPLNEDWSPMLLGQENSAAEEISRTVSESIVIKAFNTIFADVMPKEHHSRNGHLITAFVAGDDISAKQIVLGLAQDIGFSPIDVGPLRMARFLEAMAHLNIQIALGQGGGTHAAFVYHQA